MPDKTLEEVIELAIQREQDAYFFYRDIMDRLENKEAINTLEWIANEEIKHRKFLIDYRNGKYGDTALRMVDVVSYKIAENVKNPEISPKMDSIEVFLVASHRELDSYKFYTELAKLHSSTDISGVLNRIANEELKHKEKMEYLYTNSAFPQTSGG